MSQLIVTAIGADRPGIVGEFTGHLHAGGANILDSRMVNLRGQFAVIVLIDAAGEKLASLKTALPAIADRMGLKLLITEHQIPTAPPAGIPFKLKSYSMDQPGIVHRITEVLRAHGVNIEELSARQESAPFDGSPMFIMEMRLTVPKTVMLRKLRTELEAVCDEMNCELDLEPASEL